MRTKGRANRLAPFSCALTDGVASERAAPRMALATKASRTHDIRARPGVAWEYPLSGEFYPSHAGVEGSGQVW